MSEWPGEAQFAARDPAAPAGLQPEPMPPVPEPEPAALPEPEPAAQPAGALVGAEAAAEISAEATPEVSVEPEPEIEELPAPAEEQGGEEEAPELQVAEHAVGQLVVPDGYGVIQGSPDGSRRGVGVVVSRFNGAITTRLLEGALAELEQAGVARQAITVMPVPGAFELPLAAMALAKTRRYACVVALGCIIRGETPHFEYVASETASGLQLAALETGVPVAFGILTTDTLEQAEARVDKGAEAVRSALEMADVFAHLRASVAASG